VKKFVEKGRFDVMEGDGKMGYISIYFIDV
jgi:hypothetical protein